MHETGRRTVDGSNV